MTRAPALLSDAELLVLLLGRGAADPRNIVEAQVLLESHGGLRGLMTASERRRASSPVVPVEPGGRIALQAALELARRHYAEALRAGVSLQSPTDTQRFLTARLRDLPFEVFCCLYLDNRHRLIEFEEMFRGTIDGAAVHPREVLRRAIDHNAAAVIFAHNHPSGVAEPSRADELITLRLRDALALVDIRVLDHIIVAGPHTLSLAERGVL